MQFNKVIATLLFFLAHIFVAVAQDETVTQTVITEVEVTSTVTVETVTVTGPPPETKPTEVVELTTTYHNNTTPTAPPNGTVPTPSVPAKDDSGAASFSGSMGTAAIVGAVVVIAGML